ncbi:MAG: hypothetical protein IJJ38_05665 [Lachnospiraceae bacterium]|nr:hypothetical protein [Lachnospiraceae bacterium]
MAGIDNITNEILEEAKAKAAEVIAQANGKAEEILSAARKECGDIASKSEARAEAEAENYAGRISSQAGMKKRQTILAARQDMIDKVIARAQEHLENQPEKDYFSMITELLGKHVRSGEGEILFSAKDAGRLPAGFAAAVSEIAEKAGGKLSVSDETADIANGFILRYGGIEENCTLASLFAEKSDALKDIVHGVLW